MDTKARLNIMQRTNQHRKEQESLPRSNYHHHQTQPPKDLKTEAQPSTAVQFTAFHDGARHQPKRHCQLRLGCTRLARQSNSLRDEVPGFWDDDPAVSLQLRVTATASLPQNTIKRTAAYFFVYDQAVHDKENLNARKWFDSDKRKPSYRDDSNVWLQNHKLCRHLWSLQVSITPLQQFWAGIEKALPSRLSVHDTKK
ncbi:hypothetical protein BJ508DRAFT_326153 [Ascobolus immersus RN42]|uniref:Uncharacterized protein n=1 Tax=Ascobolus immersus RN42 TaxID=1160509 RepID=A0A3N4IJ82_ASCIM|nr:hypothetical protein BJ508DRAFT_326153 [Ascobolus immersus RN42]